MFLANLLSSEVFLIFTLCIALINYIFKGIGLLALARVKEPRYKWMAFVPVANSYLLGKLAGDTNIFVTRIKNTGVMLFFVHLTVLVLRIAFYTMLYLPYIKDILGGEYTVLQFLREGMDINEITYGSGLKVINMLLNFANFAYVVLFISALFALFRKYEPERYMWYSLISVFFNVEGIFIFLIRGNKEVDYSKFIKEKYEKFRNDPYNPYNRPGNPYGGGGGYNSPSGGFPYGEGQQKKPESPFGEFEEKEKTPKQDDVFPDFKSNSSFDPYKDNKNKKDDDFFR